MSHTYGDIAREIERRHGYSEAEQYKREIERDGHSEYSSVWSTRMAEDGVEDYDLREKAASAHGDLEYQEERRQREEEEEQQARDQQRRDFERQQYEQAAQEEEQARQEQEQAEQEQANP